jgi:hypothetical protein
MRTYGSLRGALSNQRPYRAEVACRPQNAKIRFQCPATSHQNSTLSYLSRSATLGRAEQLIESCEHCNEEGAQIPFDNILDRVTGSDPSVTDYILEEPGKCPNCRGDILEKTLIEPA